MAGGALEDFSRRPLQYKVIVFAGIGVLLGLLYWQFAYSPLQKERDAAKADLEDQKGEASRLKEQKRQYDELVAKEAQLKADIEQNQKALPTESEIPAFLDMLSRKTNEAGIEMHKRDVRKDVIIDTGPVVTAPGAAPPRPPPPAGAPGAVAPASFVKVPVDIEVTGTYYQLKKFFASLRPKLAEQVAGAPKTPEEKDRIVTIESLTLTDPKVKNNEIVLTARFVASTFRADKPANVPAATPATPAAPPPATAPAPGTAPGTGTAPPPAAAAKPDTMKAKTEGAMDASEKRVQQSPGGAP